MDKSNIQEVFRGARVLITGATGFMGHVLVEKLLRSCHELDHMYLIVRAKKGKTEEERGQTMLDGELFDRLRTEYPDYRRKVTFITGDCGMPGLGLSESDRKTLVQQVNVVFHSAATVRFDETLIRAFTINVMGTKQMLDLARDMRHLKAFVHISTAYSNCPVKDIDEKFYSPAFKWTELLTLIKSLDEQTLDILTPRILGDWPNTYTFTKSVAEDTIRDIGKGLPISIIRPSIVVSTAKEPFVCWINNVYGAAGVVAGAGMGLLRSMNCNSDVLADIVPADMVINSAIAIVWDLAKQRRDSTTPREDIPIYNYVSSVQQPITWGNFMKYNEYGVNYPSMRCIWYYYLRLNKHRILNSILITFIHLLPALFIDTFCLVTGKKPQMLKAYQKIHKFIDVVAYFGTQQWKFHNDNVQKLWMKLSTRDKDLFDFNMATVDWEIYLFFMIKGLRLYVLKESFDDLPVAKSRYLRLKFLHYGIIFIAQFAIFAVAFYAFKHLLTSVQRLK